MVVVMSDVSLRRRQDRKREVRGARTVLRSLEYARGRARRMFGECSQVGIPRWGGGATATTCSNSRQRVDLHTFSRIFRGRPARSQRARPNPPTQRVRGTTMAADKQFAAATCRTMPITRAPIGELRHEPDLVLLSSY
jgi:hypothetical protein